jgi:hypothetical protein
MTLKEVSSFLIFTCIVLVCVEFYSQLFSVKIPFHDWEEFIESIIGKKVFFLKRRWRNKKQLLLITFSDSLFLTWKPRIQVFQKVLFLFFSNETSFDDQFSFFDCSFYVKKFHFWVWVFLSEESSCFWCSISLSFLIYFHTFQYFISFFDYFLFFQWFLLIGEYSVCFLCCRACVTVEKLYFGSLSRYFSAFIRSHLIVLMYRNKLEF